MKKWWMESVGYQIYIKSFYDSNNDGIGDINGITQKLDYLHLLGINLIWITPFYESPMDDNGYDVSNYLKIADVYGTHDDFKNLLKKAKQLGIKIIMDFVLNHTSDEHHWFLESRKSLDNKYRDYYIWQNPKIENGKVKEPTNWGSFFGGSAWKYDSLTNSYYMKIFSNKMPDLNWENPKILEEFIKIGKFWLDLGVDGFRIDAVSHLEKAPFIDSTYSKDIVLDWDKFSNLPKVHTHLNNLYHGLFKHYDILTIGEVGGAAGISQAKKYASFDSDELNMVFNFDHNWCNNINDITDLKDLKVNVMDLKSVLMKWQDNFKTDSWLPLNWLNHDQPRVVSHYGDINYHYESATMLANLMYLSRGTPFIYQGEEIGMTNFDFKKLSDFNDISSITRYHNWIAKEPGDIDYKIKKIGLTSRDNPRTMMQWSDDSYAGFSKNKPWFVVNENYVLINVKDQMSKDKSIWSYYQKLISLRRFSDYKNTFIYGTYEAIFTTNENVICYKRTLANETIIVLNSFSKNKETLTTDDFLIEKIIIDNYDDLIISNKNVTLKPFQSIALKVKEIK